MSKSHSFISYLESLAEAEDRGALAALRRGLGRPPGVEPSMHRYVIPFLPSYAYPGSWAEKSYYLAAALFALYPESEPEGNLGSHFARTLDPNPDYNKAVERRFSALLVAHPEDLPDYLRQGISFLRSKDKAVNWHQLMWDLLALGDPDKATVVQKRWATEFWRRRSKEKEDPI